MTTAMHILTHFVLVVVAAGGAGEGVGVSLRLWLQGAGVALVALYKLPEEPPYVVRLGVNSYGLGLSRGLWGQPLQEAKLPEPVLKDKDWTAFDLELSTNKVQQNRGVRNKEDRGLCFSGLKNGLTCATAHVGRYTTCPLHRILLGPKDVHGTFLDVIST